MAVFDAGVEERGEDGPDHERLRGVADVDDEDGG